MESVNYSGNYVETELSDSIVVIEDLTDSNGDKIDPICDSGKIYHSCYVHRRDNQPPENNDDDNDPGEAISVVKNERGTPDGKSDTDIDDEDVNQEGDTELAKVTFEVYGDEEDDEEEDEEDEEEEEEEEDEQDEDEEEVLRPILGEEDEGDDEEEEEEEHIEVRTPKWTENRIIRGSDTASAESNSTSECESKSTGSSFVSDSLMGTTSQQAYGQVESNGLTSTEFSDLEDKTDFSSFQEFTNDNDQTNDEMEEDELADSQENNIHGGPNDNKGFDTVDSLLIDSNNHHHHHQHHHNHNRILKNLTEETVGLLSAEVENENDKVTPDEDNQLTEINCKPLIYLENPLIATGMINDDQVSLVTKHSTYQRHAIKLNGPTSCSASASSASTSTSTSYRTFTRRLVKSVFGRAVKKIKKQWK